MNRAVPVYQAVQRTNRAIIYFLKSINFCSGSKVEVERERERLAIALRWDRLEGRKTENLRGNFANKRDSSRKEVG